MRRLLLVDDIYCGVSCGDSRPRNFALIRLRRARLLHSFPLLTQLPALRVGDLFHEGGIQPGVIYLFCISVQLPANRPFGLSLAESV